MEGQWDEAPAGDEAGQQDQQADTGSWSRSQISEAATLAEAWQSLLPAVQSLWQSELAGADAALTARKWEKQLYKAIADLLQGPPPYPATSSTQTGARPPTNEFVQRAQQVADAFRGLDSAEDFSEELSRESVRAKAATDAAFPVLVEAYKAAVQVLGAADPQLRAVVNAHQILSAVPARTRPAAARIDEVRSGHAAMSENDKQRVTMLAQAATGGGPMAAAALYVTYAREVGLEGLQSAAQRLQDQQVRTDAMIAATQQLRNVVHESVQEATQSLLALRDAYDPPERAVPASDISQEIEEVDWTDLGDQLPMALVAEVAGEGDGDGGPAMDVADSESSSDAEDSAGDPDYDPDYDPNPRPLKRPRR